MRLPPVSNIIIQKLPVEKEKNRCGNTDTYIGSIVCSILNQGAPCKQNNFDLAGRSLYTTHTRASAKRLFPYFSFFPSPSDCVAIKSQNVKQSNSLTAYVDVTTKPNLDVRFVGVVGTINQPCFVFDAVNLRSSALLQLVSSRFFSETCVSTFNSNN